MPGTEWAGKGGRVSKRTTELSMDKGQTFEQSWTWDDLGNPKTVTYPRCVHTECAPSAGPPRTVSFNYTNGTLTGVPGYASSITYHANGMVHQVAHGNGNVDTIAQDPWRMRRPYNISVSGPVGNPSLGVHKYDGSGNLVSKSLDGLFLYDQVGRLEYFEAGSGGDQTYTYDAFGNMTQLFEQRPTGDELRNFPVSTATNRLTNAVYDDAGNMTSSSGQTYEYDGLNMLRHRNFPEHSYLYTADDERLLKYTFSGTPGGSFTEEWIWTIRDLDGKVLTKYDWNGGNGNVWEWKQDTIYRDGLMLAKETDLPGPEGEQHFHLDHLGTPRLTTQSDGSIYAANHYFGFGDALNETSDPERQKFTGHERDKNGGATHAKLDYMHARYYSPYMGRFMSVDPAEESARSPLPQSWNRYAYVRNSPLRYVDPNGEHPVAAVLAIAIGAELLRPSPVNAPESAETQLLESHSLPLDAMTGEAFGGPILAKIGGAALRVLFGRAIRTVASNLGTKTAAREALGALDLPDAQLAGAFRAVKRATASSTTTVLQKGDDIIVQAARPGRNGSQVVQTVVKADGSKTVTQFAIDSKGKIVHIDPKLGDERTLHMAR